MEDVSYDDAILVSAVYFKKIFIKQFDQKLTRAKIFYAKNGDKQVQMMRMEKTKLLFSQTSAA